MISAINPVWRHLRHSQTLQPHPPRSSMPRLPFHRRSKLRTRRLISNRTLWVAYVAEKYYYTVFQKKTVLPFFLNTRGLCLTRLTFFRRYNQKWSAHVSETKSTISILLRCCRAMSTWQKPYSKYPTFIIGVFFYNSVLSSPCEQAVTQNRSYTVTVSLQGVLEATDLHTKHMLKSLLYHRSIALLNRSCADDPGKDCCFSSLTLWTSGKHGPVLSPVVNNQLGWGVECC